MSFYFSWFILTYLLLIIKKKNSNINIIFTFIIFILIYGFRDYGGLDDLTYMLAFNNANFGKPVYGIENSYILISRFFGGLGFNYKIMFLFYAIFSFVFLYKSYNEICKNRNDWILGMLGFLSFAFIPTITIMRQFLAASIILYAFTQKMHNKNIKAYLLIFFASLFHVGSLIGFLFIIIEKYKINNFMKITIPLISLIIGYFGYFSKILNIFNFIIPSKYIGYIDIYAQTAPRIGLLHVILIMVYIAQYLIDFFTKKSMSTKNEEIDFLEKGQLFYFTFYFITLSSGWINRLSIYFILFVPFVFLTFAYRFNKTDKQLLYFICYVFLFVLFSYQIINLSNSSISSDLIPYVGSFKFR